LLQDEITVLVVDDERDHADGVAEAIERSFTRAMAVYTAKDAIEIVSSQHIDVIVTDLKLDGETTGLDILNEAKRHDEQTEVILVTAYATIETCKDAMRQGAFDYLVKPIDVDQLRTLVAQAGRKATAARRRQSRADFAGAESFVFEGVRGRSPVIERIFHVLRRVAPTNISVLIEGESGTGKELLARAIHNNSLRYDKPFRPLNCAGLSETLLESELFGHIKGAFTGAMTDRKGLFEITDKGTLFLDEIGDMPMSMQAKLLRVIEDGIVIPVGATKPIVVEVRIVSATNQSLMRLIAERKFREDLYFRIKGVNVTLPALRDRAEDIPELVNYFFSEAVAETGSKVTGITDAAMSVIKSYGWPGNIRQLRNTIRTMVVMCDREELDVQDIAPDIRQVRQLAAGSPATADLTGLSLNEIERQAIAQTLAQTKGNREKAAQILGIGERTLYRKIKEYSL
jgi:two-component system response regulator HydG